MSVELDPKLFGWRREVAEADWPYRSREFVPFTQLKCAEPNLQTYRFPWELAKWLNNGQHLLTWYQESGDCVSMGATQALQYTHAYEIEEGMEEEKFRYIFPPAIYGFSRVEPDCGNGQLGRSAGSTGAWAVTAMRNHGMLFCDDEGVPKYSGKVADDWGYRGVPANLKPLAKNNVIGAAAKIESVDELRLAVLSRKLLTYAIDWDYGTGATEHKGYRVLKRGGGGGGHQVCIIAWMDEPFPAGFVLNSWGTNVHKGPDNGEPPGGAWLRTEDMQRDLSYRFTEVFAIEKFTGDAGPPDHGGL